MKIFFYSADEEIGRVHAGYELHRLGPYLRYLEDLKEALWPLRTSVAEEADFFFVPISLISFQFADHEKRFADPFPYIRSLPYLGCKPHLIFAAGDFGQRARGEHETTVPWRPYPEIYSWLDDRFILMAFESTNQLHPQDIALFPYVLEPTSKLERYQQKWTRKLCRKRDLLYSFSGGISYEALHDGHIRGRQLIKLEGRSRDCFVGSAGAARRAFGRWRGSDVGMLSRSTFTLCPAGFGRWSFRLIQAIVYGSIPVLLSDGYVKPMQKYIDWDSFCLTLPEAEVERIPEILRGLSKEEIAKYQRNLSRVSERFSQSSLIEMIIQELGDRIASNSSQSRELTSVKESSK